MVSVFFWASVRKHYKSLKFSLVNTKQSRFGLAQLVTDRGHRQVVSVVCFPYGVSVGFFSSY